MVKGLVSHTEMVSCSVWSIQHRQKRSFSHVVQKESCSAWQGTHAHGKVKITQHIGREISLSSCCICGEVSHTIHGEIVCGLHFTRGNGVSAIRSHSLESVTRSHSAGLGKLIESQLTLWDIGGSQDMGNISIGTWSYRSFITINTLTIIFFTILWNAQFINKMGEGHWNEHSFVCVNKNIKLKVLVARDSSIKVTDSPWGKL